MALRVILREVNKNRRMNGSDPRGGRFGEDIPTDSLLLGQSLEACFFDDERSDLDDERAQNGEHASLVSTSAFFSSVVDPTTIPRQLPEHVSGEVDPLRTASTTTRDDPHHSPLMERMISSLPRRSDARKVHPMPPAPMTSPQSRQYLSNDAVPFASTTLKPPKKAKDEGGRETTWQATDRFSLSSFSSPFGQRGEDGMVAPSDRYSEEKRGIAGMDCRTEEMAWEDVEGWGEDRFRSSRDGKEAPALCGGMNAIEARDASGWEGRAPERKRHRREQEASVEEERRRGETLSLHSSRRHVWGSTTPPWRRWDGEPEVGQDTDPRHRWAAMRDEEEEEVEESEAFLHPPFSSSFREVPKKKKAPPLFAFLTPPPPRFCAHALLSTIDVLRFLPHLSPLSVSASLEGETGQEPSGRMAGNARRGMASHVGAIRSPACRTSPLPPPPPSFHAPLNSFSSEMPHTPKESECSVASALQCTPAFPSLSVASTADPLVPRVQFCVLYGRIGRRVGPSLHTSAQHLQDLPEAIPSSTSPSSFPSVSKRAMRSAPFASGEEEEVFDLPFLSCVFRHADYQTPSSSTSLSPSCTLYLAPGATSLPSPVLCLQASGKFSLFGVRTEGEGTAAVRHFLRLLHLSPSPTTSHSGVPLPSGTSTAALDRTECRYYLSYLRMATVTAVFDVHRPIRLYNLVSAIQAGKPFPVQETFQVFHKDVLETSEGSGIHPPASCSASSTGAFGGGEESETSVIHYDGWADCDPSGSYARVDFRFSPNPLQSTPSGNDWPTSPKGGYPTVQEIVRCTIHVSGRLRFTARNEEWIRKAFDCLLPWVSPCIVH